MKRIRGNALFLILIAVTLFAALSYAVSQSGRGGRGVDKERVLIDASQILQGAENLRAAITRMLLTGTDVADLTLCSGGPLDTCNVVSAGECASGRDCLFAPEGGGAVFPTLPKSVTDLSHAWVFKRGWAIDGIGTTAADPNIVLGMPIETCEALVSGLGLSGFDPVPVIADLQVLAYYFNPSGTFTCGGPCTGNPYGCFRGSDASVGYFYFTLIER